MQIRGIWKFGVKLVYFRKTFTAQIRNLPKDEGSITYIQSTETLTSLSLWHREFVFQRQEDCEVRLSPANLDINSVEVCDLLQLNLM